MLEIPTSADPREGVAGSGPPSPVEPAATGRPVIYFDGECGLCSRFVRWFARRDRARVFDFAPLQGVTAARRGVKSDGPIETWSLVMTDAEGVHEGSTGVLLAAARLGGFYSLARVLLLVPCAVREVVYRWVARHRRRWFGGAEVCDLPGPDLRDRLLP
ncbi:MAG: DCC1-like thiol-disulfide oxidoreductase family protein [Planctomycetota bacterium]